MKFTNSSVLTLICSCLPHFLQFHYHILCDPKDALHQTVRHHLYQKRKCNLHLVCLAGTFDLFTFVQHVSDWSEGWLHQRCLTTCLLLTCYCPGTVEELSLRTVLTFNVHPWGGGSVGWGWLCVHVSVHWTWFLGMREKRVTCRYEPLITQCPVTRSLSLTTFTSALFHIAHCLFDPRDFCLWHIHTQTHTV